MWNKDENSELTMGEQLGELATEIWRLNGELLYGSPKPDEMYTDCKGDKEGEQFFLLGIAALEQAQRFFNLASIKELAAEKTKLRERISKVLVPQESVASHRLVQAGPGELGERHCTECGRSSGHHSNGCSR